ncbi:TIGR04255 family protein [Nocardia spumae]|uniref:TIGR04255 family protein n=1 Tax=Nocardia spumae TaxID=2887190 RepID=UPI001D147F1A|nr:TIGR04255 family protein [Nocardia spumae]
MAVDVVESPFGSEPVQEVSLDNPPLAQVLVQVRFSQAAQLWDAHDETVRAIVTALRSDYPIFNKQNETSLKIGPAGVAPVQEETTLWQLHSPNKDTMVSFSTTFFALATSNYVSRTKFLERLTSAWQDFSTIVNPIYPERIGVRYINRIADPEKIDRIAKLVRSEMVGEITTEIGDVTRQHSIAQASYELGEGESFQARWGLLPPGAAFEASVPPASTQSWILDLDAAVQTNSGPLTTEDLEQQVRHLTQRTYRYFRWTVKDDFLAEYGGDLNGHS